MFHVGENAQAIDLPCLITFENYEFIFEIRNPKLGKKDCRIQNYPLQNRAQ